MKSEEVDRAFDDGEDVTSALDMSAARRPGLEQRRVNVDFPEWMIESGRGSAEAAGYKVSVIMSAETFIRLTLASPEGGTEEKVELAVDWRAHDPVQLAIGPVLHSDDAVANKVCALFGRALPRDFPDVDAVMSGRYTRERLLELGRGSRPRL
jgi:hypothetical protein